MDRKRKLDSTEIEVSGDLQAHNNQLTNHEIEAIIAADDYESLQENIQSTKIKDINKPITEYTHKSMLMKACEDCSIDCVKVLLSNEADVNYTDDYEYSVVSYAAASGNINLLNLILSQDALNINLVYNTLHAHLSTSSISLQLTIDVIKLLISRLPDINRRVRGDYILLNDAISRGYLDIINLLVAAGADPSVTDLDGCDALEVATREGRLDALKLLLELSPLLTVTPESIKSAYLTACYFGHIDIVSYLIEKGAHINATDEDSCHAFDLAISSYNNKSNIYR